MKIDSHRLETLQTPRLRLERRLATRLWPDGQTSWLHWAMWSVTGGRYIGFIQATVRSHHSARMAYVLFDEAKDPSCAREAASVLIDHLHHEWGVIDVWATVSVRNRASIALLERLGFLRVAVHRNAAMTRGALSDEYVYCLSLDPPSFQFLA